MVDESVASAAQGDASAGAEAGEGKVKTFGVESGSQRRPVMKQLSLDARADPSKAAYVSNFRNSAFHYGVIRGTSPSGSEVLLELQTPNRRPILVPLVMPKGLASRQANGDLIKVLCTVVGGVDKSTGESYTTFMVRSIERPNIFEAHPRNVMDLIARDEENDKRRVFEDSDLINSGANNHVQLAGICVGSRYVEPNEATRSPGHAEIHLRQEGNEDSFITVRYFGNQAARAIEMSRIGAMLYCEGRHLVKTNPMGVVPPAAVKTEQEGDDAAAAATKSESTDVGLTMYVPDGQGNAVPRFHSYIRLTRLPEMADSKSILFLDPAKPHLTPQWVKDYAKQLAALRAAKNSRSAAKRAAKVEPEAAPDAPAEAYSADV
ncbi:hypothetical protein [Ottowia thiooxydans]|uniref:hypothetical protein n=1 Tax=Ottowia thiooxydans TaxID=219182 RepID=UPI000416A641|nr:hypothetical protein [Ottowia thiooxydans]